jgi:transcription initiation factor TFIIIB Brf1 subunit/transcription initiation factor TFIIB
MKMRNAEVLQTIKSIVKKLELEPEVAHSAIHFYDGALRSPKISGSRFRDLSIAVACVYIAMRLTSKKPVTQDVFSYHYKISTATLRKTYKLICNVLGLDRHNIVGQHADKHRPVK